MNIKLTSFKNIIQVKKKNDFLIFQNFGKFFKIFKIFIIQFFLFNKNLQFYPIINTSDFYCNGIWTEFSSFLLFLAILLHKNKNSPYFFEIAILKKWIFSKCILSMEIVKKLASLVSVPYSNICLVAKKKQ